MSVEEQSAIEQSFRQNASTTISDRPPSKLCEAAYQLKPLKVGAAADAAFGLLNRMCVDKQVRLREIGGGWLGAGARERERVFVREFQREMSLRERERESH